jgi:preprotein translocase subunit SecE
MVGKIQKFIAEAVVELKKVSWSTKRELIDSTWVIIISSAFLGVFIGVTDFVLSRLISLIINS